MARAISITTYRIREHVTDHLQVLKNAYRGFPIALDEQRIGTLYVKPSPVDEPGWLDFFGKTVDRRALNLNRASSSGVLLIERNDGLFAVTFGYGRFMLRPTAVEDRFGLRTALTVIGANHIISMDRKTLDTMSMYTREQASRESSLNMFDLDAERDLLRSVTGKVIEDNELKIRITGRDALTVTQRITLRQLLDTIDHWHEISQGDAYKEHFALIDNVSEVTRVEDKERLNDRLVEMVQDGEWDKIWLTPPDIMDWADVGDFRFRNSTAPAYSELELSNYFTGRHGREQDTVTLRQLKTDRVYCELRSSGAEPPRWSVYQCLYAEVAEPGSHVYVLSEGRWHRVAKGFVEELNTFIVNNVRPLTISLPPYPEGQWESDYNSETADGDPNLLHMDTEVVQTGTGRDRMEICDLYHSDKIFIHVKRYSGSATLSHLFTQGEVSAETLYRDPKILAATSDKFPNMKLPREHLNPRGYEVAYVILGRSDNRLPFLSQVKLRNNVRILKRYGYRVRLQTISPHPGDA